MVYRFLIAEGEGPQPFYGSSLPTAHQPLLLRLWPSLSREASTSRLNCEAANSWRQCWAGRGSNPATNLPAEQRIRNIVEEMAIASGVPVLQRFRLNEFGINALAAGLTRDDVMICVSQQALDYLNP